MCPWRVREFSPISLAAFTGGRLRSTKFATLNPLKSACSWERACCCHGKRSAAKAEAAQQQRWMPRRVYHFPPISPSPGLGEASDTPSKRYLILFVSQVPGGYPGELRGKVRHGERTSSDEPISLLPSPNGLAWERPLPPQVHSRHISMSPCAPEAGAV